MSQRKQLKMSGPICSGVIDSTARNNRLRKVRDPVAVLSYIRMVRYVRSHMMLLHNNLMHSRTAVCVRMHRRILGCAHCCNDD